MRIILLIYVIGTAWFLYKLLSHNVTDEINN
jgi:hypothetical protein